MSAPGEITYLSTLAFTSDWLERLRAAVPDVRVLQITAEKPDDVPAETWQRVSVLHTSTVFPPAGAAPALQWIQLDTSGVDHVRNEAVWGSQVPITTIGGISPVPLAEYVLWAILGSAHRLTQVLRTRAEKTWPDPVTRWQRFLPAPLAGATVVVIGYGRIGREIGRLCSQHSMSVIGVTRTGRRRGRAAYELLADFTASGSYPDEARVVGTDELREALGQADYVVVVVPLTELTRNLLDATAIAAIKPGAVLINVARGGIVDERALLAALRGGALGGVILDVFDDEPLPPDSPWWNEPGSFVTPHVAGLAPRYAEQVLELVTQNLRRFRDGAPLLNRVDRSAGY